MKTKPIVLLLLMLGVAVGTANAQSTEPVTFRTPFAFVVGDQSVPSGEYTVRLISPPGLLSIRSVDGNFNVFINSVPLQKPDTESRFKVVFHHYGAHYYVSEIWTPGYRTGRVVMQHPSELELAKKTALQHVILYASAQTF